MWGATFHRRKGDGKLLFQSALPVWGATGNRIKQLAHNKFQSALPVWGATIGVCVLSRDCGDFNPRSPCGERPTGGDRVAVRGQNFNPRSPCGERPQPGDSLPYFVEFQSALPVWGATAPAGRVYTGQGISIRAPRVGSDPVPLRRCRGQGISIRAPRVGSDMAPTAPMSTSK